MSDAVPTLPTAKPHLTDAEREARLPLWAQQDLKRLRRQVEDADRGRIAALMQTDPEGSKVVINPYADLPIGLGNAEVRFRLGNERHGEYADVRVSTEAGGQPILMVSTGAPIALTPWASNVFKVLVTR